jgi:hypothetical protein
MNIEQPCNTTGILLRDEDRFLACHCLLSNWLDRAYTKQDVLELGQSLELFCLVNLRVLHKISGSYIVDMWPATDDK